MKYRKSKRLLILGWMTASLLTACNPWAEQRKEIDSNMELSVMDVLKSMSGIETFVSMLEATHYDAVLEQAQSFTVFAPENAAWPADMSNFDTLSYIKTHIAWQAFPIVNDNFGVDKIQMIDGKYLPVSGKTISIDDIALKTMNIPAQNGIIHTLGTLIEPRLNIWEYINQNYPDYMPVQMLNAQLDSVMDMDMSYQLYLDDEGRPVYDTAWIRVNEWLNYYALDNEDSAYTFIIIPEANIESLKTLYRPYFTVCDYDAVTRSMTENVFWTDLLLESEVTRDVILRCQKIDGTTPLYTVGGVKLTVGNIDKEYQASNGYVYELTQADIKIYENKVKTQYIEAENYYSVSSSHGINDVSKRVKSWARGGFDIMLATVQYFNNTSSDNDSKNHYSTMSCSNFEYHPILNSVPYKMYALCYDDTRGSIDKSSGDTLDLVYKLLASLPSAPALTSSGSVFSNNFADTIVYVLQNNARNMEEQMFSMWATTSTTDMYASYPLLIHPDYASTEELPCTSYGEAVLKISNSALSSTVSTIYMDYIKLVPVVDPDK